MDQCSDECLGGDALHHGASLAGPGGYDAIKVGTAEPHDLDATHAGQVFWWRSLASTYRVDDEHERDRIVARRWS